MLTNFVVIDNDELEALKKRLEALERPKDTREERSPMFVTWVAYKALADSICLGLREELGMNVEVSAAKSCGYVIEFPFSVAYGVQEQAQAFIKGYLKGRRL